MAEAEPLQQKGHSRSISAGGVASTPTRPSALRRGHQRAFSHGQIGADEDGTPRGHNRIASKTDFILPPGHRDGTTWRKGHSREASRTESIYTLRGAGPPSKWDRIVSVITGLWRGAPSPDTGAGRRIVPNHVIPPTTPRSSHPNFAHSPDNRISTTKYTLLSFIPKNLFEQFHRVANIYFLFIVLLNWVPQINAFGKEIAIIPVLFVLGVTGVKDLFEDRRRRASDKRINNSTCRVYTSEGDRYKRVCWKDVRVGDLVHLSNNEVVPADLLLLKSSDHHGTCYIDTCNLDGETNLKQRNVPQGFQNKDEQFKARDFRSFVEVDPPTTKLYHFHGAIVNENSTRTLVNSNNLLLRDSVIKNTDFVEGIVIYAGHETKAMLNNSGPRYKRSTLEKRVNTDILWCFAILAALCIAGAVGTKVWLSSFRDHISVPYIINPSSISDEAWLSFWTFIIILQVMIPLSLYVTIEMTKLLQVYHINNNIDLYDSETDRRIDCRALNITEQLGQIQYIFSDKTGTLTENKMIFRRCTILGVDYNHPSINSSQDGSVPELVQNAKLIEDINSGDDHSIAIKEFLAALAICNTVVVAAHPHRDSMNASGVIEGDVVRHLGGSSEDGESLDGRYKRLVETRSVTPSPTPEPSLFNNSVRSVSSIETVVRPVKSVPTLSPISSSTESSPQPMPKVSPARPKLLNVPVFFKKIKNGNSASPKSGQSKPIFEAESPDELALVKMAYAYHCRLIRRTPYRAIISLPGEPICEFEILKVLPFDAVRRSMSVVVRSPHTGQIVVYTKGADSSIYPQLGDPRSELASKMETQIALYSSQGLRVLAVAKRIIPDESWPDLLNAVEAAEGTANAANIRQAYSAVETNLSLLGATGIEDRLQSGVGEAVGALKSAGIKVWVLTGDKAETAANVAVACGLFSSHLDTMRLTARSKQSAEAAINFYTHEISRDMTRSESSSSRISKERHKCLIIDGKTLTFILDRRSNLTLPFLNLTKHCKSVLCCRVAPLQKAYIVKVVKEKLKMRTLAIGDGANDVSMIQAADVGIGISGQEGMQAVMASDFSFAKFKFLHRLLLVHGHWSYHRLASMVLYFFYKNAIFVFLIFLFQFFCGFSGTIMIDQVCFQLYNLLFTSLPPLIMGVYDQHAPANVLFSRPCLYGYSRLGHAYNKYSFWITTVDAIYQSAVILLFAVVCYWGTDIGLMEFGTTITSCCIFCMLGEACLETNSWTILHGISLVLSLGGYYVFLFAYNNICMQCIGLPSNVWVLQSTVCSSTYWLIILLTFVTALIPRFVWRSLQNLALPGEVSKAVLEASVAKQRGDNFLVSWSRSTSTSSIYRTGESKNGTTSSTLTAIG